MHQALPARSVGLGAPKRLIIVPHAGSGTGLWFAWAEAVPASIEVRVLRLPGRETRLKETPIDTVAEAIDAAVTAYDTLPTADCVMLGHSLGAKLGFEMARRGRVPPRHIFLSGSSPPGSENPTWGYANLPDADLLDRAGRRWGMIPAELRDNPGFAALLLPALRADLKLGETWPSASGLLANVSATLVLGEDDPEVLESASSDWRKLLPQAVDLIPHNGGHMALLKDPALRARVAAACVEALIQ